MHPGINSRDSLLAVFPKRRPVLPEAYRNIYRQHIREDRSGRSGFSVWTRHLESWMHVLAASDVRDAEHESVTLEIGAGNLNQLAFERPGLRYDIVEPEPWLYQDSPFRSRIGNRYWDISEIPLAPTYDRILSIAVLEHVPVLPDLIARTALLLKPGGMLRVGIPNEGRLGFRLGAAVKGWEFKRKHGLDYRILMCYEHLNTADEIESILSFFFISSKRRLFGPNPDLALYRFYACSKPRIRCASLYLKGLSHATKK